MAQAWAATIRSAHLVATVEASVGLVTWRPLYAVKAMGADWKGRWVPHNSEQVCTAQGGKGLGACHISYRPGGGPARKFQLELT